MAGSPIDPIETKDFIHPKRKFYPSEITVEHRQLHHLISSPSPSRDQLFFVENQKICRIDLATNTKDAITDLPFTTSCTAAGYGWFCAGAYEAGYFAAVKTSDIPPYDTPYSRQPQQRPRPPIRIERWGELTVNSISIHELPRTDASGPEVVAVVTNNDRTVRMYSLTNEESILCLEFEFPMNHATVSPDGRFLIVVGDIERAYIFENVPRLGEKPSKFTSASSSNPSRTSWQLLRELVLHKTPEAHVASYFTTAWSSNGRLCATASENGYISLIDSLLLTDLESDPVVLVSPSSRPPGYPDYQDSGSVRTMSFLPDPWDLLLWVEDSGRACIGDLRNGLLTRQVINLDPKADDVTEVELEDYSDMPPLIGEEDDLALHASDADLIPEMVPESARVDLGSNWEVSHLRITAHLDEDDEATSSMGALTQHERQVLDGLRTTRRRQAEAVAITAHNNSILARREEVLQRQRAGLEAAERQMLHTRRHDAFSIRYDRGTLTSLMPPTAPSRATPIGSPVGRETSSSSPYIISGVRRNSLPRTREVGGVYPSARDVPDEDNTQSRQQTSTRGDERDWRRFLAAHETLRGIVRTTNLRLSEDAGNQRGTGVELPSVAFPPVRSSGQNNQQEIVSRAQRSRVRRAQVAEGMPTTVNGWTFDIGGLAASALEALNNEGLGPAFGGMRPRQFGELCTTGSVVSEDGRTAYVGTTKGIFELHLDFQSRKLWADFEQR